MSPVEIHYRDEGEGAPLILLHGGWGHSLNPFQSTVSEKEQSVIEQEVDIAVNLLRMDDEGSRRATADSLKIWASCFKPLEGEIGSDLRKFLQMNMLVAARLKVPAFENRLLADLLLQHGLDKL